MRKVKTDRVNLAGKYPRASNKGRGDRNVRRATEDISKSIKEDWSRPQPGQRLTTSALGRNSTLFIPISPPLKGLHNSP